MKKQLLFILMLISAYHLEAMVQDDISPKESLMFSPRKRKFEIRQLSQPLSDEEYEELLAQAHKEVTAAKNRKMSSKPASYENGNDENELEALWKKAVQAAEYRKKLRSSK